MLTTIDLQSLIENAGDAIIAADREGTILLWNPAAERIFGFTAEEALGKSLDLIIPERFRKRHWDGYQQVMQTGRTRYGEDTLRVPGLRKDGDSLSIAFTVGLLISKEGEINVITAIVRDDTTRWKQERELQRRVKELESKSEP